MESLTQITEKLNNLHQQYKKSGSKLNETNKRDIVNLLKEMTENPETTPDIIAEQLSRFPVAICKEYFDFLTQNPKPSMEIIDEILKKIQILEKEKKCQQPYALKKIALIASIITKNYQEEAFKSVQLPIIATFIAEYANKSEKNHELFRKLVNSTDGGIYQLDYSKINRGELLNVWNITKKLYPDVSKARFEEFIIEWAQKYDFAPVTKPENSAPPKKQTPVTKPENPAPPKKEAPVTKPENPAPPKKEITAPSMETMLEKLYSGVRKELSAEKEATIAEVKKEIIPLAEIIHTLQNEMVQMQTANIRMNTAVGELQEQVKALTRQIQESEKAKQTENTSLSAKVSELQNLNDELENKLREAYAINSRESSLEAEKIRADLTKALAFLYEDWLDYEFSDVSEENYESLQAIVKKIFRALERNGINFKGND